MGCEGLAREGGVVRLRCERRQMTRNHSANVWLADLLYQLNEMDLDPCTAELKAPAGYSYMHGNMIHEPLTYDNSCIRWLPAKNARPCNFFRERTYAFRF